MVKMARNRPTVRCGEGKTKKRINSYHKGKRGQIEARNLWREAGYADTESQTQDQARGGENPPPDLRGSLEKKWYVEVKLTAKKITQGLMQGWWGKLINDYGGFRKPILMYRRNRENWRILCCPTIGNHEDLTWEEFKTKYLGRSTLPTTADVGLEDKPKN